LYINITLHDYLRTIVNLNSTNSTWTLVGQKLPALWRKADQNVALGLLFILEPIEIGPPSVTSRTDFARTRVSKRTTFPPKPGHLEVLEIKFPQSST
jgi:hypothetical protein